MVCCEKSEPNCILPAPEFFINGQPVSDETISVDVLNNGSLHLSVAAAEGYTYHWSGPNGFESDMINPEIPDATESMSGKYSVAKSKGICTGVASVNIDVNNVDPPCTTQINKLTFSGPIMYNPVNFYSVNTSSNSGDFEIRANGSNGSVIITFAGETPPDTGVYEINTECPTSFIEAGQVCILLYYYNDYAAADSGSLYVTKDDNGNYSATFCEVTFNSSLVGTAQITEL
jgi:hypothetical protein